MRVVPRGVAAALFGMGMAVSPAGAEVQGHYLGSLYRTEGLIDDNRMLHRYDATFMNDLPGKLALDLSMYLSYESKPGITSADLFRSRFQASLRKSWWRVQTEFTPWQRTSLSSSSSRQRYEQLGLLLTPPGGPHITATIARRDRESVTGPSSNRDSRARISHTLFGLSPYLGFQSSRSESGPNSEPQNRLESWTGGLGGARNWGNLSAQASYDFQSTSAHSQDRWTENRSHWTTAGAGWAPHPKFSINTDISSRWTKNEDHIGPEAQWLNERTWASGALYLPVPGLSFSTFREYRKTEGPLADLVSDFAGLRADLRREIVRRVTFQSGFSKTFDLRTRQGPIPLDQAYGTLDGWLRDGLSLRGELRALANAGEGRSSLFWQRMLGLRVYPTRKLRLEATWHKNDLPGFIGIGQTDTGWDFNGTYQPSPRTDVTATYRRLTGQGRIPRQERYGSLGVTRRLAKKTTFTVDGVKRTALSGTTHSSEGWVNADLTFWLPQEFRVKTTVRWQSPGSDRSTATYGLIVDKSF